MAKVKDLSPRYRIELHHVLVRLYPGYGLGDAVQMSSVLRHLAKHRPEWVIDYTAEEGFHQVGRGIVSYHFPLGTPTPHSHYDTEVQIVLYDTWANWHDRPNTRVSSCLHEQFGLGWDSGCGRYMVNVSPEATAAVRYVWTTFVPDIHPFRGRRCVALHYKGDSSPARKDLSHAQADVICDHIIALGRIPLLLDWRDISPVPRWGEVCTTGRGYFSREWGRNAEMNCAVIQECEAFVGIDSGPGKCAAATDTPALITWTGHHPAPFHDPAPNTVHLAPEGYHGLYPVLNDAGVIKWFESNYQVRTYKDDPVMEIKRWLTETLR